MTKPDLDELLKDQERRLGIKVDERTRHAISISLAFAQRAQKELEKIPDPLHRVLQAETMLYNMIDGCLYGQKNKSIGQMLKDRNFIRVHVQHQFARILSAIDTFPDKEKFEEYRNDSHKAFLKWRDSMDVPGEK